MRERYGLRMDVLVSDIREYLEYQGCYGALIEQVDENRIMIIMVG